MGDAMGYLMNGGGVRTRRFAATVLDGFLDFTRTGGAYSSQIDWLHREFQEDVKKGLYGRMNNVELSEFLLKETLRSDKRGEAALRLLFEGCKTAQATIPL